MPVTARSEEQVMVSTDSIALASMIVQAYVRKNRLTVSDVPGVLRVVHATLVGLADGVQGTGTTAPKPAVPVKRSVTPDYLVCLEDGKKLKMLKRYLRTHYNLSVEEYRTKWGLPHDYPTVAPSYAAKRSGLAKSSGLGIRTPPVTRRKRG